MNIKNLRLKQIECFNLSPKDVQIRTKSGNTTQFNDRIGWARRYFHRALFIDIPQNGLYRLTERGRQYFAEHDSLTIEELKTYPEYVEYASRKTKGKPVETAAIQLKEELAPQEQIEYSHDEGIDGVVKEDKLGLDSIYVQAKRYEAGVVGRKEIQSFVGALTGKGANKRIDTVFFAEEE